MSTHGVRVKLLLLIASSHLLWFCAVVVFIQDVSALKLGTETREGERVNNEEKKIPLRKELDSPTSAVATIEVNLIFVASDDVDNAFSDNLVDDIVEHLDDHYVDTETLESKQSGSGNGFKVDNDMDSVKFNFQAQVIRLGPTVLSALQRVFQSNSYGHSHMHVKDDSDSDLKQWRYIDANAMTEAIDSLASGIGLANETNLFIMDLKPRHVGQDMHYGYRGDMHLMSSFSSKYSKKKKITEGISKSGKLTEVSRECLKQLEALDAEKKVNDGYLSRRWDVELSTKTKVEAQPKFGSEDEFLNIENFKEETKNKFWAHPSMERLVSLGESWGRNMLMKLESDEKKLGNFLDLDDELEGYNPNNTDDYVADISNTMISSVKTPAMKWNTMHALRILSASGEDGFEKTLDKMGECTVDAWVSSSRSAWLDMGSGPLDWGPAIGGRGIKLGRGVRHIIPALGSFLHSLIIKHGRVGENVEMLSVPEHIAVQFYVVDGHGHRFEPLDVENQRNGGFDLDGFRRELERLVLPDQTFSFVVHHLDMDEDPDLGVAFVKSIRSAVSPTFNMKTGKLEREKFRYVDSKTIYKSLENDERRIGIGFKQDKRKNKIKKIVLPVFLFSVDGTTPTFIDIERHQAKALKGMVLVVQSIAELWDSTVSCEDNLVSQSLRNPAKAALLATLELWGKLDLYSDRGSAALAKGDWSWTVGNTVFSRTNPHPGLLLSQLHIDAFHRATVSHVFAASHMMQRSAYRTIRAARSILGSKQQYLIKDLHGVELQVFTCWNVIVDHVRCLNWHAAFQQLNPLLRKSRLLLKAANRVATEAKISCEVLDDVPHRLDRVDEEEKEEKEEIEMSVPENLIDQATAQDGEDYEFVRSMMLLSVLLVIFVFLGGIYYFYCKEKVHHWISDVIFLLTSRSKGEELPTYIRNRDQSNRNILSPKGDIRFEDDVFARRRLKTGSKLH